MNDLTPVALAVFAQHHGVATGLMLQRAGISRNRRRRLVAAGLLVHEHRRVYRLAGSPITLESRCAALCLEHPQGFITGPTGGRLSGLRRMGVPGDIHFSVPHGSNIGPIDGVHLRQSTRVPPRHVVHRRDGIVIASASRLAFDLAADLTEIDHASVVEQLLKERRCTMAALGQIGRELAHPARRGSMLFLKTIATRLGGGPLESHPEVVLGKALQRRGIPVVAQLQKLALPNGRHVRIDLAVPAIKWAIEIDVHGDHFGLEGGTNDRRRDRQCHQIGWQVERVTVLDLADLDALCDELVALYEQRLLVHPGPSAA
jgi:hypothetical protein